MSRRGAELESGGPNGSGEHGEGLVAGARYHGPRFALLFALAALVTLAFPPERGTNVETYEEDSVATEDVIALIGFSVPKTAAELETDRRIAAELIPPTFIYRAEAADTVSARLRGFFTEIDSSAATGDTLRIVRILQANRIADAPTHLPYFLDDESRAGLRRAALEATAEILPLGIADPANVATLTTSTITVRRGAGLESITAADVLTSPDFYSQAVLHLPPEFPAEAHNLFRFVLLAHFQNSLDFDATTTEEDRSAARQTVSLTKDDVLQGEAIVRAADPIGPATLERLTAYRAELARLGILEDEGPVLGALVGAGLVNLLLFSIFGLLLYFSRPKVYGNLRWLTLLAALAAVYFAAGVVIDRGGFPIEWLPIAFVALPVAVLWDTRMALLMVLVLAAVTGTLGPFSESYGTVLILMVTGAGAAMSVRAVRRRSETWVSIAIIAGSGSLASLGYGLATGVEMVDIAGASAIIAGNATASALLAVGFLFVFELFTGITTDQTLLEWADPSRPLLRRLSMEAPGTYAHTLNVANLSEAAATEIGANGLLCRVGVLYHDVGKMLKPHYFVENQHDGRNPHDKLKPETSASIIREHVTEGVKLAREEKVPSVVTQFILEHHGTQRIGFFYEKAREEAGEELDPGKFSYPGPKPQSKETAIVMLADSCESATRAPQEPTPERVHDLIESIVDSKVGDGQLDQSPLTLAEVAMVKDQFAKILGGVVHRRIEYPETKHLTDGEEGEGAESVEPVDEPAGA